MTKLTKKVANHNHTLVNDPHGIKVLEVRDLFGSIMILACYAN